MSNRFLLWGLFGAMQVATPVVLAPLNIECETRGVHPTAMDAPEGAFEILSIAMIWLAFFPPAFHRSWVAHVLRAR